MPRLPSRPRLRLLVAIATWTAVASLPAVAQAGEERPVVFSLSIEESPLDQCGGKRALAGAVEKHLRRSAFVGDASSDIRFAVVAAPENAKDASWRAQIVEKDRFGFELGRRDVPLPARDCSKALDTLAVVLAIMIGPARTTTDPPWQAEPVTPAPVVAPPPPSVDRTPRPAPRLSPAPEGLRWTAGALAGVSGGTGILPGAAWGLEVGGVLRPPVPRVSLIARAAYWPGQMARTLPPAEVERIGGTLLGCYELFRFGAFSAVGCGGADVSRIQTRSADLTVTSRASIVASVLGEARLGYRFALRKGLFLEPFFAPQVGFLLQRDRFTYRDPSGRERTLLFPAPAAFQASFGIAVHFV